MFVCVRACVFTIFSETTEPISEFDSLNFAATQGSDRRLCHKLAWPLTSDLESLLCWKTAKNCFSPCQTMYFCLKESHSILCYKLDRIQKLIAQPVNTFSRAIQWCPTFRNPFSSFRDISILRKHEKMTCPPSGLGENQFSTMWLSVANSKLHYIKPYTLLSWNVVCVRVCVTTICCETTALI